jgi:alkylation response protein AidB-like acyl-CoA dehydrogenase
MDFAYTPEQVALQQAIREFAGRELRASYLNDCDAKGIYPETAFKAMAQLGWIGIPFPAELGGADGSVMDTIVLSEQLARSAGYDISAGFGLSIFCGLTVRRFGTAEQKASILATIINGDRRFSTCISEPDAGSDAFALKTRAVTVGQDLVISGQKMYCTGASLPGTVMQVACRTSGGLRKQDGISLVLVDASLPGIEVRPLPAMGRGIMGTNIVYLDEVRVGKDCIVGPEGQGWSVIRAGLNFERAYVSAAYVGAAQAVVDEALAYAAQRHQFGKPISSQQTIAHRLADMQTQVDAARLLVYQAACVLDEGEQDPTRFISQAKLFASEAFSAIARQGLQVLGGYGYITETSMQRHLRDACSTTITAGTSEIHRSIIARKLGIDIPFS